MAIVVDTETKDMKELLELTPEGFIKNEFTLRVLDFKSNNQIFAIKRLRAGLGQR